MLKDSDQIGINLISIRFITNALPRSIKGERVVIKTQIRSLVSLLEINRDIRYPILAIYKDILIDAILI